MKGHCATNFPSAPQLLVKPTQPSQSSGRSGTVRSCAHCSSVRDSMFLQLARSPVRIVAPPTATSHRARLTWPTGHHSAGYLVPE